MGGTLFFLVKALKDHWQEVTRSQIDAVGWATLAIALGVTLLAHIWSGWIWTWILYELNQPVPNAQFVQIYLKTNIAKYLPGNVWHYYGRISAAKTAGIPVGTATLSVLLEPLLMAAAALVVVLIGVQPIVSNSRVTLQLLPITGLAFVLIAVHPRFLNAAIYFLGKLKLKANSSSTVEDNVFQILRYPLKPLLGELGFIGLRGTGFLFTLLALRALDLSQIPLLLGAFSFAWLLGLVVPLAPGGLGVFEATAIALLQQRFSGGLIISAIALYRVISILAETIGAGLAWLDEQRCSI